MPGAATAANQAPVRWTSISGNAQELDASRGERPAHDATLTKPMTVQALLEIIGRLSPISWVPVPRATDAQEPVAPAEHVRAFPPEGLPARNHLQDLYQLGGIGYVRGIREMLAEIARQAPETSLFIETLEAVVARLDLPRYMDILTRLLDEERR